MKTTAFEKNLSALLTRHGTYTAIAKQLQVNPRSFRSQRAEPTKQAQFRVAQAARVARLRECLRVLRTQCGVSRSKMHYAMITARRNLEA